MAVFGRLDSGGSLVRGDGLPRRSVQGGAELLLMRTGGILGELDASAPIFNSFRRIMPALARANEVGNNFSYAVPHRFIWVPSLMSLDWLSRHAASVLTGPPVRSLWPFLRLPVCLTPLTTSAAD